MHKGDFRGYSKKLNPSVLPFDLVWFDCGALPEYVDFIEEYWRLINPEQGMLLLHYTYWRVSVERIGALFATLISGPVANEIKRQQLAGHFVSRFELLSLVEPHKTRQGSVTMIRKIGPASMCRNESFESQVFQIMGTKPKPFARL